MTRALLVLEQWRQTFWVLPAVGIALAIAAGIAVPAVEGSVDLPDAVSFSGGPETARTVLQIIATIAVSVAGISFSVIVVALVLASQQLSPRVLRSFQRQALNQAVLALFLSTAAFSIFVLAALDDRANGAPELSVTIAMLLAALSLALFVVFLHHVVRSLNASAIIRRIAAEGHRAVESAFPAGVGDSPDGAGAEEAARRLVERSEPYELRAPRAGYLASIDTADLMKAADACDGLVEQRRAIGDFSVTGGLLAILWCAESDRERFAERVSDAFVLHEERLVDDDVALPLRQLADVALKGLSPGINDPTTAENAMDSVTDTLVRIARQPVVPMLRLSSSGQPRFRAKAPSLGSLVKLGFDEARRDGARRPSFAVRLLALLAELRETGGPRAQRCDEIDRQARALRDHAIALADVPADAELVRSAYERLHGRDAGGSAAEHDDAVASW